MSKMMKASGATNAATPLDEVRTGKSNLTVNTNSSTSPQLILVGYEVDKRSVVLPLFRREVSHG